MIQHHHADLMKLVDAVAAHPREFNAVVADLYRFDTKLGPITLDDCVALTQTGGPTDQRVGPHIMREEIEAFAAYLRAVARAKDCTTRLINSLETQ